MHPRNENPGYAYADNWMQIIYGKVNSPDFGASRLRFLSTPIRTLCLCLAVPLSATAVSIVFRVTF